MLKNLRSIFISLLVTIPLPAAATVVEFQTVMGTFKVNLFDETTPETVQNFLDYVNAGAYANNVVHRSETGFVIQGGGFQYNGSIPLDNVNAGTPVINEPVLSNVRGTIAMAKSPGGVNSATVQWFINLSDNSANLDVQNGGFTAFGQVIEDGMLIVDEISDLTRFNLGGAANSIPLRNYTADDLNNDVDITDQHLVIINDIVVVDAEVNTNPQLNPKENTLIKMSGGSGGSAGGGGSLSYVLLLTLMLFLGRAVRT